MKKVLLALGRFMDRVSWLLGMVTGAIIFFMMAIVCYEVVMRYLLHRPTIWVLELSEFMLVGTVFLALAYTLSVRGHVRVDLVTNRLPPHTQNILALVTSIFALFYAVFVFLGGLELTRDALAHNLRTPTLLMIPFFPVFIMMPIGAGLLCLQFLVTIGRDIGTLMAKAPPPEGAEAPRE